MDEKKLKHYDNIITDNTPLYLDSSEIVFEYLSDEVQFQILFCKTINIQCNKKYVSDMVYDAVINRDIIVNNLKCIIPLDNHDYDTYIDCSSSSGEYDRLHRYYIYNNPVFNYNLHGYFQISDIKNNHEEYILGSLEAKKYGKNYNLYYIIDFDLSSIESYLSKLIFNLRKAPQIFYDIASIFINPLSQDNISKHMLQKPSYIRVDKVYYTNQCRCQECITFERNNLILYLIIHKVNRVLKFIINYFYDQININLIGILCIYHGNITLYRFLRDKYSMSEQDHIIYACYWKRKSFTNIYKDKIHYDIKNKNMVYIDLDYKIIQKDTKLYEIIYNEVNNHLCSYTENIELFKKHYIKLDRNSFLLFLDKKKIYRKLTSGHDSIYKNEIFDFIINNDIFHDIIPDVKTNIQILHSYIRTKFHPTDEPLLYTLSKNLNEEFCH